MLEFVPDAAIATDAPRSIDAGNRIAMVEAAIAVFRRIALHEASPAIVAAEANVSVDELTRQFPTWNSLILATIDRWNGKRMASVRQIGETHGAVTMLRRIVQTNVADPALMRLLTSMINVAATPDHPMAALLQSDWRAFHNLVKGSLARDVDLEREPRTMDPARGAEQLIALYEGLQLQFMVRPGMDLLDSYDRAVTRLRHGWSVDYVAPSWNVD